MVHKPKIKAEERDQIAILLASQTSLRDIAKVLGRSVSSVSEEVKRNSVNGVYSSISAQTLSEKRNKASRKINPLKDHKTYSFVADKLRSGWSPEQIAGRLKKENKGKTILCHETIYRYIYSEQGKQKNLSEYLTRHHFRRRKQHTRHLYQRGIQNRVSIHLRPKEVEKRKSFGHWEGDVVEGRNHGRSIQTLLERKTRYYQAAIIEKIDSEYGVKAQHELLSPLPKQARKTLTLDNGKENYNHQKLVTLLGIQTYFCDPYCSWQRGSNENHNGILRRYIPKKTDLTDLYKGELEAIIEEINQRPRKCLNYETPNEAFQKELKLTKMQKCSDST